MEKDELVGKTGDVRYDKATLRNIARFNGHM
jgi:hypothetical protein